MVSGIKLVNFLLFQVAFMFRLRGNNASAASAPASNTVAASGSSSSAPYKGAVRAIMLTVNLGFMIFMAAVGALGISQSNNVNDTGIVFVGIYLILFAAVVTIFEISQLCPGGTIDNIVKKNFGFLYGYIGKGLFLLL